MDEIVVQSGVSRSEDRPGVPGSEVRVGFYKCESGSDGFLKFLFESPPGIISRTGLIDLSN